MTSPLILLGYMGCGKTKIGKRLSKKLSIDFIDLDQKIESHYSKTISQLFNDFGEIGFRKIERKILELLETQPHKTQISTKEIAKAVRDKDDKNLFEPIKRAARRLESTNSIIITQKGKKVDSSKAKGHLQIRKHHGNPRPN